MNSVKSRMLFFIPTDQKGHLDWLEDEDRVMATYVSKKGRLMCVVYDKKEDRVSNFPID